MSKRRMNVMNKKHRRIEAAIYLTGLTALVLSASGCETEADPQGTTSTHQNKYDTDTGEAATDEESDDQTTNMFDSDLLNRPTDDETTPATDTDITLISGYGRLDTPGYYVTGNTETTIEISRTVKCVSEEDLRAFIEKNEQLIGQTAHASVVDHPAFKTPGNGADLLLVLLGAALKDDVAYYADAGTVTVVPDDDDEVLLTALHDLGEKTYEMSGPCTAVSNSVIPITPRYYAKVAKLTFPDGGAVRGIDTAILVTDQFGSQDRVTGKKGEAPLTLTPIEN
jgi:hypothetical protein